MNIGENYIIIEQLIYQYARNVIASNGITPIEARTIMKNVYCRYQEECLEQVLMSRIITEIEEEGKNNGDPEQER